VATVPRSPGVYKGTCRPSAKVYIGSSVDMYKRVGEHIRALRRGDHANPYLQHAWDRYGEAAFEWEAVEETTPDELLAAEQYYLDKYRAYDRDYGYNIAPEAGSTRNLPRSASWSQRISDALKRRFSNPANHPNTGKPRSEETRQRISRGHMGKQVSAETRQRSSDARRGKPTGRSPSAEERERIAESNRAYRREHPPAKWDAPMSDEQRKAIGMSNARVFYIVTHPANGAYFVRNLRDFARRCALHEQALHVACRSGGPYKEYRARYATEEEIAAYLPYLGDSGALTLS
jgi:group I intron endonuclease